MSAVVGGSVGTTNDAATKIAEPLTVLDEQTQHELRPPCDCEGGRCGSPAAVVVIGHRCPNGHLATRSVLMCNFHAGYLVRGGPWRCWRGGESMVPLYSSVEPLR